MLAEHYFHIPWLLHLDVYRRYYKVDLEEGGKPDFMGIEFVSTKGQERWHIFESKGRTGGLDMDAIQRGKEQTLYVNSINGTMPESRNVVQSYFSFQNNVGKVLNCYLEDPAGNKKGKDIEIDTDKFLHLYYKPIYKIIKDIHFKNDNPNLEFNSKFEVAYIFPLDIYIGIDKNICMLLRGFKKGEFIEMIQENNKEYTYLKESNDNSFSFGTDGVFVKIGNTWSSIENDTLP